MRAFGDLRKPQPIAPWQRLGGGMASAPAHPGNSAAPSS